MIKQKFLSDIADLPEAYWVEMLSLNRYKLALSNNMSGGCELLIFVFDNFHIKIVLLFMTLMWKSKQSSSISECVPVLREYCA